jgi:hypothetical protein
MTRKLSSRRSGWIPSILAGLLVQLVSNPVMAAQRVAFRFGELQRSVPVADLVSFVSTGIGSKNVAFILDPLSQKDRDALRFALGHAFPVTSLEVSDFLQTSMGGVLVRQFAKLVDRAQNEAVPALSGALILGASGRRAEGDEPCPSD